MNDQTALDPGYGRTVVKLPAAFPQKAFRTLVMVLFVALLSAFCFHDRLLPRPGEANRANLRDFHETGLAGLEFGHGDYWRWGLGPEMAITFTTDAKHLTLHYAFNNPLPDQSVRIFFNGELLHEYSHLQACRFSACIMTGELRLNPIKERNTVLFAYADYNGGKNRFSTDNQPYALCFHRLYITRD